MLVLAADPRRALIAKAARLAALAVLVAAGTARAEDKAAAKEHYTHARSLYDLGHFAEAAKEFEAAYELKNDPAFLYDLAQSYRQAGNPEQALHFYRTYLRYVPKPANRAEIDQRVAALEQQLAQKGTSTEPPPPPVTTPPPAATAPPPPPAGGSTAPPPPPPAFPPPVVSPQVAAEPPPSAAPPPVSPVSPPVDRGRTLRIAGIATAGAGAFMVLLGLIEYNRAASASNEVNHETTFDPAVEKRGQSAQTAEAWFLTLGLLAGGGGAALWYFGHQRGAETEVTTSRVSVAPVIAPGGGGAWLRFRF